MYLNGIDWKELGELAHTWVINTKIVSGMTQDPNSGNTRIDLDNYLYQPPYSVKYYYKLEILLESIKPKEPYPYWVIKEMDPDSLPILFPLPPRPKTSDWIIIED